VPPLFVPLFSDSITPPRTLARGPDRRCCGMPARQVVVTGPRRLFAVRGDPDSGILIRNVPEVADSPPRWKDGWMRALQFTTYGDPDVLEWAETPDSHAGSGEIRIAVRAASVNPIDWKTLSGMMSGGQQLSGIGYLGYDAAGGVDEVGEGVTGMSVGDEVFGRGRNTQADYAVLTSWAAKPSSIDWAVAAAAGVAGETAERGLRLLGVQAGDTFFVDGGAGGVGAVAVQMALARKARGDRVDEPGQPGLSAGDRGDPGALRA